MTPRALRAVCRDTAPAQTYLLAVPWETGSTLPEECDAGASVLYEAWDKKNCDRDSLAENWTQIQTPLQNEMRFELGGIQF